MQRATFTSADPTLRITLSAAGIAFTPHHMLGNAGVYALHIEDDTPFGTGVGIFTSDQLWKLITERAPGQSIADLLLGRVARPVAAE